jgi:hypothetical protein
MMIVFALGMSRPFSTMVVDRRMSNRRSTNPSIARSSSSSPIWPCADGHRRLGDQALQQRAQRKDGFDPVVDEVHLAAARQLVADGAFDDRRVEPDHCRLDGEPIPRRRFNHGHVANADERHVQRARESAWRSS